MKIYLSGTRIYQWLLASTKKDLTLYKNTISNAEVQRTSLLHKNKSKTNWFPMICQTGPACGWRKTWSMKREICLNQQQSFLMLAMVLLTFLGERKASLCLTDFFCLYSIKSSSCLPSFFQLLRGKKCFLALDWFPPSRKRGSIRRFFLPASELLSNSVVSAVLFEEAEMPHITSGLSSWGLPSSTKYAALSC